MSLKYSLALIVLITLNLFILYKYFDEKKSKYFSQRYSLEKSLILEEKNDKKLIIIFSGSDCVTCTDYLENILSKYNTNDVMVYFLQNKYNNLNKKRLHSFSSIISMENSPLLEKLGLMFRTPLLIKKDNKALRELLSVTPNNLKHIEKYLKEIVLN